MKKKTEETPMHCSLCGAEHNDHWVVKDGWFGIFKTEKRRKIMRLICPACLKRLGVKVSQS
jgi:hypothetical protein